MKLVFNKKDYIDIYTCHKTIVVECGNVIKNAFEEVYEVNNKFSTDNLESVLNLVGVKLTKFSDEVVEYVKEKKQILRIKRNSDNMLTYSFVDRYTDEVVVTSTNINDLTAHAVSSYYNTSTLSV